MNRQKKSEGLKLTERSDLQPFQGWGFRVTSTQSGASLTLGFGIEPHGRMAAQQCHAGAAEVVSIVCSALTTTRASRLHLYPGVQVLIKAIARSRSAG